ncbi:hypothetical protein L596_021621 [Steinernema carpocapsae]|uniref:Sulfotransferase domain-containing protein n=1 Tax=Steinernema carpocapsae TaxID=34508 RepID=A0A4U5MJM4_STECR|nr:hypothetical protein L596_021621 [Steinernema carpocapsae]
MPEVGTTFFGHIEIEDRDLPSLAHETPPCSPLFPSEAQIIHRPGEPKQALIDGEMWPPVFKAEFVRSAKALQVADTDVFVCTYPKCGTTWIQHICSQLLRTNYGPDVGKELAVTSPMIERMGAKFCETIDQPRLLKTHFSYGNLPKNANAKYIFAVRNPKDCLTSYFFHNRNFKIYDWENGDFEVFYEMFINGQLAFGDYFDHLKSWLPEIDNENVLFLKYEDMVADLSGAVEKIGHFLGGRAADIVEDPVMLRHIVDESTIDSMKKNQGRWFPSTNLRKQTFIRKGGSRDWKNYFTREQSDRLDAVFRTKMAETIAAKWWKREMCWDEEDLDSSGDDEEIDELSEMPSISRRGSHISSQPIAVSQPVAFLTVDRDNHLPAGLSSASSGYGSLWSHFNRSPSNFASSPRRFSSSPRPFSPSPRHF